MMFFNRNSTIQSASRRFCTIYKSENSVPCQSFGRLVIPSGLQQHVRTTLSVWQASGFLSKTQLWEDRCNRPDEVDSRQDALIHKSSIAFKKKTFGRQSSWSERTSIRYENCVHQINRLDDHPLGPDAWSLGMEITCSGSATVRMTRHHRSDASQIRKEFQQNFRKPIAQLSVRMPFVYRPDGA
jgi:hypothetical protein